MSVCKHEQFNGHCYDCIADKDTIAMVRVNWRPLRVWLRLVRGGMNKKASA